MNELLLNTNFENNIYNVPSEFESINLKITSNPILYEFELNKSNNVILIYNKINKLDKETEKDNIELYTSAKSLKPFNN